MPYIRNTGMNSLSELFAMKKNMASQVKFDHQMASMTRDYYHRKYNMNMDIKKIFDDMIGIQSSTGYTLGQSAHARSDGKPDRIPNAPKVYLPPIGVRLVEKYVGFDVKRRKSLFHGNPSAESCDQIKEQHRNSLPQVRRNFRKLLLKNPVKIPKIKTTDNADDVKIEIATPTEDVKHQVELRYNVRKEKIKRELSKQSITSDIFKESEKSEHGDVSLTNDRIKTFLTETEENDTPPIGLKQESSEMSGQLVFYTSERRSSRSTYRKRASAILLPRTDSLRAHNWQVISDQGYVKSSNHAVPTTEHGKFFLDYGDGKLHTTMKIPKIKDCARSWCNATCKTCQARAASKPCFMLIPSGTQERQNMLLLQKRRESLFPGNKDNKPGDLDDEVKVRKESNVRIDADVKEEDDPKADENAENKENENDDDANNDQSDDDDENKNTDDDNDEFIPEIEKLLLINRKRTKKGYDKNRINDLAQPRYGHPAEVRFSKWSLRKKRDQLKEKARTEQLSHIERDNLAMIQGKISLFLAVLNECEDTSVPRMTHLPIREHVQMPRNRRRIGTKSKTTKTVGFKTRARIRLLT